MSQKLHKIKDKGDVYPNLANKLKNYDFLFSWFITIIILIYH